MQQTNSQQQQQPPTVTLASNKPCASMETESYAKPETCSFIMRSFPSRQAVWLGVTLIVAGWASIAFNIIDLALGYSGNSKFTWGAVGHGIWTGTMCVSTGAVGIVAAKRKTKKWVTGFLIDSLIAAALTSVQFIIGMFGATIPSGAHCWNFDCDGALVAMQALLAVMAVVEGIAAIWSACICCKSSVTVPDRPTTSDTTTTTAVQSNLIPSYRSCHSTTIGIILIVAGMCSWAFNIVDLVVGLTNWKYYFTWGQVGHGLWTGMVCVATGAVGIETAKTKTKPFIISFNVLCLATAVFSAGQFVIGILGVADPPNITFCSFSAPCDEVLIAMEACLLVMASIQGAVATWGSVICFNAFCCLCVHPNSQPAAVVYFGQSLPQNNDYTAEPAGSTVYQVVVPASSRAQTIQVVMPPPGGSNASQPPAYDNHAYHSPPSYVDDVITKEKAGLH